MDLQGRSYHFNLLMQLMCIWQGGGSLTSISNMDVKDYIGARQ